MYLKVAGIQEVKVTGFIVLVNMEANSEKRSVCLLTQCSAICSVMSTVILFQIKTQSSICIYIM